MSNTEYCCEQMRRASQPCAAHADNPLDCPDQLISWTKVARIPGIRIHDGGTAVSVIAFCPWCGTRLQPDDGLAGNRMRSLRPTLI